jgi:hypothetical protein
MARNAAHLDMYEGRREPLLTGVQFRARVMKHTMVVFMAILIALSIGVVGYHATVKLPWIDSLLNASMILGGMGPVDPITTTAGKLFASVYALFSGVFFLAASAVLIAPFLHRLLHHFHLETKDPN